MCKTCGGCLGLRNIFLLLHFAVNSVLASCSCSLVVLLPESRLANPCKNVSTSKKIVRWNSFMFLKDFEIPKMKVPVNNNVAFYLRQGKNCGHLKLRKNPTALKWRRNTSTKERVCTQVCKVGIQLLQFLVVIKWNKST